MHTVYDLGAWDMPLVRRKASRAIASLCWRPESALQVFLEISERGRIVGIGAPEELQLIEAVATARFEVESELVPEAGLAHRPGHEHIGQFKGFSRDGDR